ncbi:MAG: MAPEG family protein [Beijerinckiaceae bacterium]
MSIALWSVLIAALLPVFCVGIAKLAGGRYDNHDPRARATTYEGMPRRAYAAHQNSYEAFPLFAAAVLVAEMKGAPRGLIDQLALLFIGARLGYILCYLMDWATLRSVAWFVAFASAIAIFTAVVWG